MIKKRGKDGKKNTWINCDKCNKWYHIECENLKREQFELIESMKENLSWECNKCKNMESRKSHSKPEGNSQSVTQKLDEIVSLLSSKIEKTNEEIKAEIKSFKEGINQKIEEAVKEVVQKEIKQVKDDHETIVKSIEDMDMRLKEQLNHQENSAKIQVLREKVNQITEDLEKLQKEKEPNNEGAVGYKTEEAWDLGRKLEEELTERMRREDRKNNLIIFGIPEREMEQTEDLRSWLSKNLEIDIKTDDITKMRRIGGELEGRNITKTVLTIHDKWANQEKERPDEDGTEDVKKSSGNAEGRSGNKTHRPIQIECINREVRDRILGNAKQLRLQKQTQRIFINPDRTYQQRQSWKKRNKEWRPTQKRQDGNSRVREEGKQEEAKPGEKPGIWA